MVGLCDELDWVPLVEKWVLSGCCCGLRGATWSKMGLKCYWWELTEVWNKPWLLAEPLVELDFGSLLLPRVQDEASREVGDSSRQWMERFFRGKHVSGEDRAAHELRCLFGVLEEACGWKLRTGK